MSDAARIVEQLLTTDGVHAFVLVCEAADKYLPMIDSLTVPLANGQAVKVTDLSPEVARKVEETRKTLKREDRIVWALRQYKKGLVSELLWMTQHEPEYFQKKTGSPPAPDQTGLQRQLQKLSDVDISPFMEADPDDPESFEPPYSGYGVIETINDVLGRYLELADTYGEREPDNPIHKLMFQRQTFGEIASAFRRGQMMLMRKYMANWEAEPESRKPYDLRDAEGPIQTLIKFPNGWRWFNLHRKCSTLHGQTTMGHCGNTASAKSSHTIYELAEPVQIAGKTVWKPHATFILDTSTGKLGEMKGRKNQKPSPRLWKYILELLRQRKEIIGLEGHGYESQNNFFLKDLPDSYLDALYQDRPEIWQNSDPDQLPTERQRQSKRPKGTLPPGQGPAIQGHLGPAQPA